MERAEASGELASNTASTSSQAKPTLLFSHVVTAMRLYWLAGTEPLRVVAAQLLKDYDSAILWVSFGVSPGFVRQIDRLIRYDLDV